MGTFFFTSESVAAGHPDKVADQISDAVLDAYLKNEPEARVACETMVCPGHVFVAGETRAQQKPNVEKIIRETVADIGYANNFTPEFDAQSVKVVNTMGAQSAEIAQGVDENSGKAEGAGDQGLMFGYACRETEALMPAPLYYCQKLMQAFDERRRAGESRLGPDAKCQLTVRYDNKKPAGLHTVVVSHQHTAQLSREELTQMVHEEAAKILPQGWLQDDVVYHVNPTGSFIKGGPAADVGLTGRKIIVDTYGGLARHGGGAFSGKDPTKVDRSAAYAARYLAKNIVAAELAERCEIQLCYAIGVAEPLAIHVETFNTEASGVSDERLRDVIREVMDLTPKGIRTHLQLNRPIYQKTASYGHFGRDYDPQTGAFSWEQLDLVDALQQAF
jgi:S-adenosylmethionine synthetase